TLENVTADLLGHMEWADALVWKTVLASPAAAANATIRDRLHHLHHTQHAFLQIWQGSVEGSPSVNALDVSIESFARWARSFYKNAASAKWNLKEESLHRQVPDILLTKAEEGLGSGTTIPTIGDTVLQVILHTAYHRGQISKTLRELGCAPPLTEYFVWVWE